MKKLLLLLGALFGGALLLASPASAHATVVDSSPRDGARLDSAPSSVTVTFDESVGLGSLSYLHVTNQSGDRVETSTISHPEGDNVIGVDLPDSLPDGTYTESYRVVSADSHPVAGTVRFVIGNGPLVTTPVGGSGTSVHHSVSVGLDVSRWISWAGLALLGGAWLLLTVWPDGRDDRRAVGLVWTGWAAAVLGAALELLIQGPYVAGYGLGKMFTPAVVDATLHSDYGQWHCGRLLVLGLIALLLGRSLQPGRSRYEEVAAPLAIALAFTFAATGHAETTNPRWVSLLFDTAHLMAMATWVGGLTMLLAAVLPRRDPEELDSVLPVFSKVALTAVVVLAVTGTYAAYRGIGSWRAFFHTEYGLLLVGKILLFVGLLALANLSRRVVQRRFVVAYAMADNLDGSAGAALPRAGQLDDADGSPQRGKAGVDESTDAPLPRAGQQNDTHSSPQRGKAGVDEPTDAPLPRTEQLGDTHNSPQRGKQETGRAAQLRRSVLVELVLAVVVLGLTAALVGQPRGAEALAAQDRQPVTASADLGNGASATVTIDPGTHGPVDIEVTISGTTPKKVTATASQPDQQLGPIPVDLRSAGAGVYSAGSVDLPVSGDWVIDLVVTSSAFDAVTADVTVHLA